jgi:hypothetical protein
MSLQPGIVLESNPFSIPRMAMGCKATGASVRDLLGMRNEFQKSILEETARGDSGGSRTAPTGFPLSGMTGLRDMNIYAAFR